MSRAGLRTGFALGAALAGTLVAALRIVGVADRSTAAADEVSAPVRASTAAPAAGAPPAEAAPPAPPQAVERWRTKPAAPATVTARVVSRAARAPAPARTPPAACPAPEARAAAQDDGTDGTAGPRTEAALPCGSKAESVEIDWHAPAATP